MISWDAELARRLRRCTPDANVRDVLTYAVLPAGKLFRPRLLEALAQDYAADTEDVIPWGCALELHHAYSLVHDDLPSMDNDLVRRGKPSTHVQFGEWRALLAGDALLALSYSTLEELNHTDSGLLRRLFHWGTGARGLILGQWIDLSGAAAKDSQQLMRMHELKTARLMQLACAGAQLMSGNYDLKPALRLGASIGLVFQLLDDLDDLSLPEHAPHEDEVNPFLLAPAAALERLRRERAHLQSALEQLPHTAAFVNRFLAETDERLCDRKAVLKAKIKGY
jgi:geranylgeranyl pyrophosphate synthase